MASIIDNQRVAKRHTQRRYDKSSSRYINKSASFNYGFMSHFSQKPARSGRKISLFDSVFTKPSRPQKQSRQKPKGSGFSFPVPSLTTLAVVAGTVLIALAALKWDELSVKLPDSYAFQPNIEAESENRTMRYAATGISGILPFSGTELKPGSVLEAEKVAEQVAVLEAEPVAEKSAERVAEQAAEKPIEKVSAAQADTDTGDLLVSFKWQNYKVKKGDSVSGIAQKFGVSVGAIIASNEISNARRLQEGASLRVPNIDGIPYKIRKGDNLTKIATSFNVPLDVILDVNDIKTDKIRADETIFIPGARMNDMDLRLSLGELFIYPLQKKYITSNYGMRKDPISGQLALHTGIDLRADTGTNVLAAMDGTASVVGENWLYGKHIILSHGNGYKTLYAHLNSVSLKQGDKAARGRKIGESGNTGYSTGPHLHFGVYDKNGKTVNPLDLLN